MSETKSARENMTERFGGESVAYTEALIRAICGEMLQEHDKNLDAHTLMGQSYPSGELRGNAFVMNCDNCNTACSVGSKPETCGTWTPRGDTALSPQAGEECTLPVSCLSDSSAKGLRFYYRDAPGILYAPNEGEWFHKVEPEWTPTVGEYVWCAEPAYHGIARVITLEEAGLKEQDVIPGAIPVTLRNGGNTAVHPRYIRPLTDADWWVEVEGLGKVRAEEWHPYGVIVVREITPKLTTYMEVYRGIRFEWDMWLSFQKEYHIPVKPYEGGK